MSPFMTAAELAARWRCTPRHVRRLCAAGELRAMRVGEDAWRIAVEAVEVFEAARATGAVEAPPEAAPKEEGRFVNAVDGFSLPADYEPVFPELWPGHEPQTTKKAAVSGH